jgi:hypothetical protein
MKQKQRTFCYRVLLKGLKMEEVCISKQQASKCVAHHFACDCREYRCKEMRSTLIRIMIWAEHDAISVEPRRKAMADIAKACHEALED